jgi:hypothetical protein
LGWDGQANGKKMVFGLTISVFVDKQGSSSIKDYAVIISF